MSSEAGILHADADAFYASIEQRDDPRLRRRPVLVGGGVVLAASYEARLRGVRSGMGGRKARSLCPDAVVVPPRFDAYVEASRQLFEIFRRMAPVVIGVSLEEAFLDVRGLERIAGTPEDIALALREAVRLEVGLPLTVGGARSRALAKVASRAAKPDGVLIVPPERERAFLDPLPVEALWGVGPATGARLRAHGLETVGSVARTEEMALVGILGRAVGRQVHAWSHGRDMTPMRAARGRRRRSVGAQHAMGPGPHSRRALDDTLKGLADRVTRRMRSAGRTGRTVTLRLRFGDFAGRATRSRTLPAPTAATSEVLAVARELLAASMPRILADGLTLIGLTMSNIVEEGGLSQMALALDGGSPARRPARVRASDFADVDAALDEVRRRYGSGAVTRAALLGRDRRLATWLLPDDDPGDDLPRWGGGPR